MKVLFIGGTGVISSACSTLALAKGVDLYHLNRGRTKAIRIIPGVKTLSADIRNAEAVVHAIGTHQFDAIVDWLAFEPAQLTQNLQIFQGKTRQYVLISSASAYQKPPQKLPITEDTPLENPFWDYSRQKIACEEALVAHQKQFGLPYTIIRPSHTYDKTMIPLRGGYTAMHRMQQGKPVVVHGDGTSIWTLTHHKDFAVGLVGLLGNPAAINEAFHITSGEWLSWNQIYHLFGNAMGVEPHLVHVPSRVIAQYHPAFGDNLLGDKSHSLIFDNSKIKAAVPAFDPSIPFKQGVSEIVKWYADHPAFGKVDPTINQMMDRIIGDLSPFGFLPDFP